MFTPDVQTSADACKELPSLLKHFREEGIEAKPLVFGSHREPEAVIIPYDLYEHFATIVEDQAISALVRERSAEGPAKSRADLFVQFDVEMPR